MISGKWHSVSSGRRVLSTIVDWNDRVQWRVGWIEKRCFHRFRRYVRRTFVQRWNVQTRWMRIQRAIRFLSGFRWMVENSHRCWRTSTSDGCPQICVRHRTVSRLSTESIESIGKSSPIAAVGIHGWTEWILTVPEEDVENHLSETLTKSSEEKEIDEPIERNEKIGERIETLNRVLVQTRW